MKIILVIQSIIIIAGAIYIFTLHQTATPDTRSFEVMTPPPPPPPPSAPAAPVDTTSEAAIEPITMPPSDAEMEWPIPDTDLQVR